MDPTDNVLSQAALSLVNFTSSLNLYILLPLCLAVAGLFVSYVRRYQQPANELRWQLSSVIDQIRQAKSEEGNVSAVFEKVNRIFEASVFSKVWIEYCQSLHAVHPKEGTEGTKNILATAPAEMFFSRDEIVDARLNTDFFRHLPGILTGVGIIGTFSGLVWGLHEFNPSPGEAVQSLPRMLQEVTSAFIGSGLAILAAIFITYNEKTLLNQCYRLVEDLNKEIDGLHAMGAEQEYLSRLVTAAESHPDFIKTLKDALIGDLSKIMNETVEKQIGVYEKQHQEVAAQLAEAVAFALKEPMGKLSGAMQVATIGQRDAVSNLLEGLLEGFISRLDGIMGQQIQGINGSIQKTCDAMERVQNSMSGTIGAMTEAHKQATDRMFDKLDDSISRMTLLQDQTSLQALQQQKQSSEIQDASMRAVLTKLQDAMEGISTDRGQQMAQEQKRYDELTTSVNTLCSSLSENVARMTEDLSSVTAKTNESLSQMQYTAIHAITGMKDGASSMAVAAERFSSAGNSIVEVTTSMSRAAEILQTTSLSVHRTFEEYDRTQGTVERYVSQMQELLDTLGRESRVSQNLVDDMERIVTALSGAERQSKEYMDRINEVLKQAFRDFGLEMVGQVRNISAESNRQLGTSLHALSGTVDSMVSSVSRLRRAG